MIALIGGIWGSGLSLRRVFGLCFAGSAGGNTSTPRGAAPAGTTVPAAGSTVGKIDPWTLAGRRCLPSQRASLGDLDAAMLMLTGATSARPTKAILNQ